MLSLRNIYEININGAYTNFKEKKHFCKNEFYLPPE